MKRITALITIVFILLSSIVLPQNVNAATSSDSNANATLVSSDWKASNGKINVTGTVVYSSKVYQRAGIVAIGYDKNGKAVETKCVDELQSSGKSKAYKLVLDAGSLITRVEVKPTGNATDIVLLSSADRLENGKVIATGTVENGTNIYQRFGMVATGYDENNKAIETKCIDDLYPSGGSNSYKVVLDAGTQIKRVEIKAAGSAKDIVLLSSADRLENGKIIATASVENGTEKTQQCVVVATGYDENDKVIETKSSSNNLYDGFCKSYNIVLANGSLIKRVEVILMVDDRVIEMSSQKDKQEDKKDNKKVVVTGTATNSSGQGQYIGIVATGYDENDKPVETKCVGSFELKGKSKSYTLELDAGSIIKRVEVKEAGNATGIELLSAADRLENGKVIVTGSVENGPNEGNNIGIVATGFDKNNKPIETKCISSFELKGSCKSYQVVLEAGSLISRVEVKATGDAEFIQLLSSADRLEKGKVIVTGSVENGPNEGNNIGIVATGFDKNNKPIETKCISSFELKGSCKSYQVVLDAGSLISRVEVKATGEANGIVLLSEANRTENDKVIATASVENGTKSGENVTVIFTAYDGNKKVVEEKSQRIYIRSKCCQSFSVTFNSGSKIKAVSVKIAPTK